MIKTLIGEASYPGVYCIPHIIFLAIALPLFVVGIILVMKYVKQEKHIRLLVLITAGVLLALIVTNRVAYTYQRVVIDGGVEIVEGEKFYYNWGYLLPETFCGLTALTLPLAVFCFKKDNVLLHALTYFGIVNGVIATAYPSFLDKQYFFDTGSMTSLIYHLVMLFLSLVIILKKYMIPTIKRWYVPPIVNAFFILIVLFEVQVLKTPDLEAMSIFRPLISSLPHLGMWYCIDPAYALAIIIFLFLYEHFKNEKNFKAIVYEMFFIKNKVTPQIKNKKNK